MQASHYMRGDSSGSFCRSSALHQALSIKKNPRSRMAASRLILQGPSPSATQGASPQSESAGPKRAKKTVVGGKNLRLRPSVGKSPKSRLKLRTAAHPPEPQSRLSTRKAETVPEEDDQDIMEESQAVMESQAPQEPNFPTLSSRRIQGVDDDEEEEDNSSFLDRLVLSNKFDGIMGFVVAANAFSMGVEYQHDANELEKSDYRFVFHCLDFFFILVFTIELLLRTKVLGLKTIISTPVLAVDAIIVVVGILTDIVLPVVADADGFISNFDPSGGGADGGANQAALVKLLKTLRAFRALRVLRMLTMFQDLCFIVQMFVFSLRPLFWTVLFIFIIIFLFAMFSISLIGRSGAPNATHLNEEDRAELLDRKARFSTTIKAVKTLFQIMTLDEWAYLVDPLFKDAWWTYFWFLTYISIAGLALMNMVTASVLESARTRTKESNFEMEVDLRMMEVEELFQFTSGYGVLKKQDFVEHWDKIRPIKELFARMGLDDDDAEAFYDLMDLDHSGFLDHGEMAQSFLELKQVLQDPNRVSLFRGAASQKERLTHVARALEASQYVRFAREVRKEIKRIHNHLDTFHEQMASGIIKTLALDVVPEIVVGEIRAATRNEIQKTLAVV